MEAAAQPCMTGRVLGLRLSVDEVVTQYEPPVRKSWQTVGEPRLLVIGGYAMGVELRPVPRGCDVRVWIDYGLPGGALRAVPGRLLGHWYARWCVDQMLRACQQRFPVSASA